MRATTLPLAACALLLAASLPSAAQAFDLTGHWIGKWRCSGFDGGKFTGNEKSSTLAVTQTGNTIAAIIDGDSFFYNGTPVPDATKPEKGEVVLLACPTANTLGPDEAEIVRAAVKTKAGTFKATFKGTSIFADDVPEVGTCKYKYKRIDTTDPGVSTCIL